MADQIEQRIESASYEAEDCMGVALTGLDFQWTSYPTPEATQISSQEIRPQSFQLSEYRIFDATRDPPMSFRDRHRFLDEIYNSYPDPTLITAEDMGNVSQKIGLLMEEVLDWFKDEKSRRTNLFASSQCLEQTPTYQFPPSPESIRASSASSSYNATSPGPPSKPLDIFSRPETSPDQHMLSHPKAKRGRPIKKEIKAESTNSSPDAKRKKLSVKYPCPDCRNFVAVEHWTEHIRRKHFPDYVWECTKVNKYTANPCSANPFYRIDNFETHLKGEHKCAKTEVDELKESCKHKVIDFFHKVCGFCDENLPDREESIHHIKDHFRRTFEQVNAPADFGISAWKEKCGIEHKLQRGIHYRINQNPETEQIDEAHEHHHSDNEDQDGGSSAGGSPDYSNHDNSGFQSGNSNDENGHGEGTDLGGGNLNGSCRGNCPPQENDGCEGHDHEDIEVSSHERSVGANPLQSTDSHPLPTPAVARSPEMMHERRAELLSISSVLPFAQNPCTVETCSRSFTRKSDLRRHLSEIHGHGHGHCIRCNCHFDRRVRLSLHMKNCSSKPIHTSTSTSNMLVPESTDRSPPPSGSRMEEAGSLHYPDLWNAYSTKLPPPYSYRNSQQFSPPNMGISLSNIYAEAPQYALESQLRQAPSNYSSVSGPSASSSQMGEPNLIHKNVYQLPEWTTHGLGLPPSIVGYGESAPGSEYTFQPLEMEEIASDAFKNTKPDSFASKYPSTLDPEPCSRPLVAQPSYISHPPRRPALASSQRFYDEGNFSSEEQKSTNRCKYPGCGKSFKDLKAHMLTHQNERPEKCPIQSCYYNIKGFARKYDKHRHTLTHYKGTMVCGFCPASDTAAKKSFNRADVFKRHLVAVHGARIDSVHGARQHSNSRKSGSDTGHQDTVKRLSDYAADATGNCSICGGTFDSAQNFYEHLDDCVLRLVQQELPIVAIDSSRLLTVEKDENLDETRHITILDASPHKNEDDKSPPTPLDLKQSIEGDDYRAYPCLLGCSSKHMFQTAQAYKRHLKNVHSKAIFCEEADCSLTETFATQMDLERHIKTAHSKDSSSDSTPHTTSQGQILELLHQGDGPQSFRRVLIRTMSSQSKKRKDYPSSWGWTASLVTTEQQDPTVYDGAKWRGNNHMIIDTLEHEADRFGEADDLTPSDSAYSSMGSQTLVKFSGANTGSDAFLAM